MLGLKILLSTYVLFGKTKGKQFFIYKKTYVFLLNSLIKWKESCKNTSLL